MSVAEREQLRRVSAGCAQAALAPHPLGVEVCRMRVPRRARGRGHGRALLAQICADADAGGIILVVARPTPFDLGPRIEAPGLAAWLGRAGFHPRDDGLLVRAPRRA